MRAALVGGPRSKLYGARCGLCPHPVSEGESVLFKDMPNDAYLETRLVFHTSCMEALVSRAPAGAAHAAAEAEADRIRDAMRTTGCLYPQAV